MQTLIRSLTCALVALSALLNTSCSATGKFKYVGQPPIWDTELDAPTDDRTIPNTMRIRLYCATLEDDDEFVQSLGDAVRAKMQNAGLGDVTIIKDRSKLPHYEIIVYEAGEDGRFDFNEEAGVWGALGAGVATGIATESLGYGVAAAGAGGVLSALAFGEKKTNYAFAGICRQRTSVEGQKTATGGNDNRQGANGGLRDDDTGTRSGIDQARQALESSKFNFTTNSWEFPFMFQISVTGGSMSSESTREAAARETFLKKFPGYVTGGTVIG